MHRLPNTLKGTQGITMPAWTNQLMQLSMLIVSLVAEGHHAGIPLPVNARILNLVLTLRLDLPLVH